MKRSSLFSFFLLFVLAVVIITGTAFTRVGGSTEKHESQMLISYVAPQDEAQMKHGEEIYNEKCIVCHMADGKGIPGAFPPVAQSDYLLADKVRAVAQVLNGSNEPMTVNGVKYTTPMPPQVDTKEDAVAVINYVLNNFGNDGGYVTLEDVKDVEIKPRN